MPGTVALLAVLALLTLHASLGLAATSATHDFSLFGEETATVQAEIPTAAEYDSPPVAGYVYATNAPPSLLSSSAVFSLPQRLSYAHDALTNEHVGDEVLFDEREASVLLNRVDCELNKYTVGMCPPIVAQSRGGARPVLQGTGTSPPRPEELRRNFTLRLDVPTVPPSATNPIEANDVTVTVTRRQARLELNEWVEHEVYCGGIEYFFVDIDDWVPNIMVQVEAIDSACVGEENNALERMCPFGVAFLSLGSCPTVEFHNRAQSFTQRAIIPMSKEGYLVNGRYVVGVGADIFSGQFDGEGFRNDRYITRLSRRVCCAAPFKFRLRVVVTGEKGDLLRGTVAMFIVFLIPFSAIGIGRYLGRRRLMAKAKQAETRKLERLRQMSASQRILELHEDAEEEEQQHQVVRMHTLASDVIRSPSKDAFHNPHGPHSDQPIEISETVNESDEGADQSSDSEQEQPEEVGDQLRLPVSPALAKPKLNLSWSQSSLETSVNESRSRKNGTGSRNSAIAATAAVSEEEEEEAEEDARRASLIPAEFETVMNDLIATSSEDESSADDAAAVHNTPKRRMRPKKGMSHHEKAVQGSYLRSGPSVRASIFERIADTDKNRRKAVKLGIRAADVHKSAPLSEAEAAALLVQEKAHRHTVSGARDSDEFMFILLFAGVLTAIPALQAVMSDAFADHVEMQRCHYNFQCHRNWSFLPAFNHILSNLGYCMAGTFLIAYVYVAEKTRTAKRAFHRRARLYPDPRLFYAVGVSIILQGVFSALYHVCPTVYSFQFDTMQIFFFAGICFVSLYSKRHGVFLISPLNFFGAFCVILVINAVGVYLRATGQYYIFWAIFLPAFVLLSLFSSIGVYFYKETSSEIVQRMLRCRWLGAVRNNHRSVLLMLINLANALVVAACWWMDIDSAIMFLAILLADFSVYLCYYMGMKLRMAKYVPRERPKPYVMVLFALALICMCAGLFFFTRNEVRKSLPLHVSRYRNRDCRWLTLDSHDMWHFFSAIAIMFTGLLLYHLDDGTQLHMCVVF